MQTLLLPAARPAVPSPAVATHFRQRRLPLNLSCHFLSPPNSLSSLTLSPPNSSSSPLSLSNGRVTLLPPMASSSASASFGDDSRGPDLATVAKRLELTARSFKRLGTLAFWGQLVCTLVAAVILSFSIVITGKITSPATFYATAGGIAAAFISVFYSFGHLRLSETLRRSANQPSKAPARKDVIDGLKVGIRVNILGMGAAILGLQATVGLLVAKALTTSATPYYQGVSPGYSPVLALDVFLVQASANTILSHFFGLVSSLLLLQSVSKPTSLA